MEGVTAHDFVGSRCNTEFVSAVPDGYVRKQVSHILEGTMDKSTTSRTTNNFAYDD